MNPETSTYLDAVRLLAACIVMLCHVDEYLVRDQIPFVQHLGIEAVGVFFVLSGFVIGFATETRERDLATYALNRIARLYSVVMPCFAITFGLDALGRHFMPAIYGHGSTLRELAHIVFSLSFLNYAWFLPHAITPGTDGAFWSLCFEVPYYVIFGALFFLRGVWRFLVPLLAAVVVGPDIIELFPLWLLGFCVFQLCRRRAFSASAGRAVLAAAILSWTSFETGLWVFDICPDVSADIQAGDLLMISAGICFAVSIAGFNFANIRISRFAAPVRWLSGATFTIYLLHFPVACFLNGMLPTNWPPLRRWAIIVALTLAAAFITAQFTERRKQVWRRNIERIFRHAVNFPIQSPYPRMKETRDDKNSL